jgi:hypothetical protein
MLLHLSVISNKTDIYIIVQPSKEEEKIHTSQNKWHLLP